MKMPRPTRFAAALIALFSVLFMQFAVASYVCPQHLAGQTTEPTTLSMSSDLRSMTECQGMDSVQPNLCHAHDQAGNHSLDKPELPQVQPFVAATLALTLSPIAVANHPLVNKREQARLVRSTAPPLSIQHCCFRI
jgi:hypothetical protein